jgi:mannitol/fructose-specific phosphotransferase system IIA component (Ntr-type)
MRLPDFIAREAIITNLEATTKQGAVSELVHSLHRAGCFDEAGP